MKLACRYCGRFFHDVEYGEGFLDGDRYHYIVAGPAGLLSGQKKEAPKKTKAAVDLDDETPSVELKTISPDDFFDTEPESLPETLPEVLAEVSESGIAGVLEELSDVRNSNFI